MTLGLMSLIDGLYAWRLELTMTLGLRSLIDGLYTWRPELTMTLGLSLIDGLYAGDQS